LKAGFRTPDKGYRLSRGGWFARRRFWALDIERKAGIEFLAVWIPIFYIER